MSGSAMDLPTLTTSGTSTSWTGSTRWLWVATRCSCTGTARRALSRATRPRWCARRYPSFAWRWRSSTTRYSWPPVRTTRRCTRAFSTWLCHIRATIFAYTRCTILVAVTRTSSTITTTSGRTSKCCTITQTRTRWAILRKLYNTLVVLKLKECSPVPK